MISTKAFSPRDMQSLAEWVYNNGTPFTSERGKTIEIVGASLLLSNPLNRLDAHRYRRLNLGFAIAEWLGMLFNDDRLDFYTKFVASYGDYSSDGVTVDGAYGPRIAMTPEMSDIDKVVEILREKPESRRAVVTIYDNSDLYGGGGLNTPCTISMQFLVRRRKLHMITNMRSNDVHYGLTNDVIVFTLTQEYVARQLGVALGPYHHFAGSLHVYDDLMKKFAKKQSITKEGRWPHTMMAMPEHYKRDDLLALYSAYQALKPDMSETDLRAIVDYIPYVYSRNLLGVGAAIACRNGDRQTALYARNLVTDPTLRRIVGFWVDRDLK